MCATAKISHGRQITDNLALTEHCPLPVQHVVLPTVSVQQRRVRVANTQTTSCSHRALSAGCGASCFAGECVQLHRVRVVDKQPTSCSDRALSAVCTACCFAYGECAAAQSSRGKHTNRQAALTEHRPLIVEQVFLPFVNVSRSQSSRGRQTTDRLLPQSIVRYL